MNHFLYPIVIHSGPRLIGRFLWDRIPRSLYVEDIASTNTTACLEAKIDALRESMEIKIESQNSKYAILIWMIGAGVTLLIASNFIGGAG